MALTEREHTVLSLLDSDLSESDIARQLFVSRDTVHSHTKSIYRKLGASTRAEAVALARAIDVQHPDQVRDRDRLTHVGTGRGCEVTLSQWQRPVRHRP